MTVFHRDPTFGMIAHIPWNPSIWLAPLLMALRGGPTFHFLADGLKKTTVNIYHQSGITELVPDGLIAESIRHLKDNKCQTFHA